MTGAILLLALAPRLLAAIPHFYHHADEIWQYLEPAYHLGGGPWIQTWEWRLGMRSWLLPTLIAGPWWLVHALTGSAAASAVVVRMLLAILSLAIVAAGMAIGARVSRLHAAVTGLVLATSFELIFFSTRPLSETVATALLLPAAALLTSPLARRDARSLVVAGLLLGLCFGLRFQFAPALGILALLTLRIDLRAWGWMLVGAAGGLAIDAASDLAQGAMPFRWVVANFTQNLAHSANFGTEPAEWYVVNQVALWSWLTLPMVALVVIGGRRVPVLVVVALVHVAAHSLIPHKEYRFVLPAVALLLIAAGIGTADVIRWVSAGRRRWTAAGMAAFWLGISAAAALTPAGRTRFHGQQQIAMWRALHAAPGLCGFASFGQSTFPAAFVYIDRHVPVYAFAEADAERALAANVGAVNAIVIRQDRGKALLGPDWHLNGCYPTRSEMAAGSPNPALCLFARAGSCAPGDPRYLENAVRSRVGN